MDLETSHSGLDLESRVRTFAFSHCEDTLIMAGERFRKMQQEMHKKNDIIDTSITSLRSIEFHNANTTGVQNIYSDLDVLRSALNPQRYRFVQNIRDADIIWMAHCDFKGEDEFWMS